MSSPKSCSQAIQTKLASTVQFSVDLSRLLNLSLKMLSNVFIPKTIDAEAASTSSKNVKKNNSMNFREIACNTGVISGASGSAFISFGETKVFCAVYGPRANQRGAVSGPFSDSGLLECDVRISTANSHFLSSSTESRISQQLRDALIPSVRLSSYPKAVISIYAVVVQSGGSELAAVISCASLALADASIEINDLVCAATVGLSRPNEGSGDLNPIFTVDPCREDYCDLVSVLTLSSMISCDSALTHLSVEGYLSSHEFGPLLEIAKSGCTYLRSVLIDCLKARQLKYVKMR